MSLKNPVTPAGIDLGTVRLVALRLNHYAVTFKARSNLTRHISSTDDLPLLIAILTLLFGHID